MTWKARFLWAFLVSIAITVVLALAAIVYPGMPYKARIFASVLLFAVHSLVALLGAVLWPRARVRPMVAIGVGTVIVGGLLWFVLIWENELRMLEGGLEKFLTKIGATLSVGGLVLFLRAVLLWPEPRGGAVRTLCTLGWAFAATAGLLFLSAIWTESWWGRGDLLVRMLLSCLTLSAGFSLAVFIVARLTQRDLVEHEDTALGNRAPVRLDCPRCGGSVKLIANTPGRCPSCDLRLRVEFEEPRCSCGYLLYGLTGETCPECGREIAGGKKWETRPPE